MDTDNKTSLVASGMTPGRAVRWVDILPESHGRGIIASSQQNASALLKQPEAWSQPVKEAELMRNITPRKPKRQFPCYVYLFVQHAHEPERRLVKIGIAKNPVRRLRQLQTGNPHAIFSHFVMKCHNESAARYIEHNLHELYASRRIPGSEWFRFSPTRRWEPTQGNVQDDSAWFNLEWMFAVAQTANPPNWDALGARAPYSADGEFDPMADYLDARADEWAAHWRMER